MKPTVGSQADKPNLPFRVKHGRYTVSLSTEDEAKRVVKFISKILKDDKCD